MELAPVMNLGQLAMEVHVASVSPVACARESQAPCEKWDLNSVLSLLHAGTSPAPELNVLCTSWWHSDMSDQENALKFI